MCMISFLSPRRHVSFLFLSLLSFCLPVARPWLWPFPRPMRYFLGLNVSKHQKWLSTQNGINFSLVRPPHSHSHTHTSQASSRQCKPIPVSLSANKWLPAGWKKGTVRNALNHFQLIPPPPCLKGQFFHGVCVWRGPLWLWWHTQILIYYPLQQYLWLADLTHPDLLASGNH